MVARVPAGGLVLVVGFAVIGCRGDSGEPIPDVLADQRPPGDVPLHVADAVDEAVVVGRVLSAVPEELPPCDHGWEWEDNPTLDGVFIGVEIVSVVLRGTGVPIAGAHPETALVHCDYALDDGQLVHARHGWSRQPGQAERFHTDAWADSYASSDIQRRRAAVSDVDDYGTCSSGADRAVRSITSRHCPSSRRQNWTARPWTLMPSPPS